MSKTSSLIPGEIRPDGVKAGATSSSPIKPYSLLKNEDASAAVWPWRNRTSCLNCFPSARVVCNSKSTTLWRFISLPQLPNHSSQVLSSVSSRLRHRKVSRRNKARRLIPSSAHSTALLNAAQHNATDLPDRIGPQASLTLAVERMNLSAVGPGK